MLFLPEKTHTITDVMAQGRRDFTLHPSSAAAVHRTREGATLRLPGSLFDLDLWAAAPTHALARCLTPLGDSLAWVTG